MRLSLAELAKLGNVHSEEVRAVGRRRFRGTLRSRSRRVVLVIGDAIVQLMIKKQLGVKRRPVETHEDQIETLFEET